MQPPIDWDEMSYCCEDGCKNPATHRKPHDELDDVVWMVCCEHARQIT